MNNVTRMPSAGAGRLAKSMRGAGSVMVALHSAALADNGRGPGQVQQKSGRASPAISFVYLSAECLFNKFYGINCRPKFDTKLLDRFFRLRCQLSPPVNNLRHCFLDGSQHVLYCNFTIGSRHGAVACLSKKQNSVLEWVVSSVSFVSTSLSVVLVEPSSA